MPIPDNLDMFERHDAEQERNLAKLPVCNCCDEPITDEHAYCIEGTWYCEQCMHDYFRKEVEEEW